MRLAIALLLSFPSMAFAFSNPAEFGRDPTDGGGGGRYFTGAPGDGYACSVCHQGDAEAAVTFEGLPEEFEAGVTYPITLRFEGGRTGVALEIANRDGGTAGTVALPDPPPATDLCGDASPSSTIITVGDRNVVMVDACGATSLTVDWTAPDSPAAWIYYGLVEGDVSGDPNGDRTWSEVVPLGAAGAPTPRVNGDGGCAAATGRSSGLFFLLLLVVWRRR